MGSVSEHSDHLRARTAPAPLRGVFRPPGDKSISHRALILATLAAGTSEIKAILRAKDVEATATACRQLGAEIEVEGEIHRVRGTGATGLVAPKVPLDMGNSGTAMRLLAGVLAGQPFDSELIGDESLQSRPMRRIADPLTKMGAVVRTQSDGCAPISIEGGHALTGIRYDSPVASAQIKSCVLLAGLYAKGVTSVAEPSKSRDHTERMLSAFGADLPAETAVTGGTRLRAASLEVPADISSAAFFLAAGAMVPDSEILVRDVGLNPTRDGVLRALRDMGCDLRISGIRKFGSEPVGDIEVRWRAGLKGIDLPPGLVPSMIDELPVFMVVAAVARGVTRIRGAEELRFKESDRLAVMTAGLRAFGIHVDERPDGMDIEGRPGLVAGNDSPSAAAISVNAAGDHRCAMSFCVLSQALGREVRIDGAANIDTSYPGFVQDLGALGGAVAVDEEAVHG